MKKSILVLISFLVVLCVFTAVSAEQNGNDTWCNSDQYGCWVTEHDDYGYAYKSYIQFWSTEARQYIMGDNSNELVGSKPAYATDKMNLRVRKGPWLDYNKFDQETGEESKYTTTSPTGQTMYYHRGEYAVNTGNGTFYFETPLPTN